MCIVDAKGTLFKFSLYKGRLSFCPDCSSIDHHKYMQTGLWSVPHMLVHSTKRLTKGSAHCFFHFMFHEFNQTIILPSKAVSRNCVNIAWCLPSRFSHQRADLPCICRNPNPRRQTLSSSYYPLWLCLDQTFTGRALTQAVGLGLPLLVSWRDCRAWTPGCVDPQPMRRSSKQFHTT